MKAASKYPGCFVRLFVILLCCFIVAIICCNFFCTNPRFYISWEIISLITLLLVLGLSEAFDNFSVGRLFSMSRSLERQESDNKALKKENFDLRSQIVNISANLSQNQSNATFVFPSELKELFSIKKATDEEKNRSEKEIEEVAEDAGIKDKERPSRRQLFDEMRNREKIALRKLLEKEDLERFQVIQGAKFTKQFEQTDPVSEFSPIFDAYVKTANMEIFMEIKMNSPLSLIMFREKLYLMLSKINCYRNIKKANACLILCFVNHPEKVSERRFTRANSLDRVREEFAPAINNGLLRIVEMDITSEDCDKYADPKKSAKG